MIDRSALLSDLQTLLKRLEADLLERSESAEVADVGESLRAEYDRAKKAERTAQNYEDWRSDAITQAAAAWVLSCVFVRFLEDNRLIDTPKIAGPKDRLQQARDEHELYFREHPSETDREYLLSVFDELAKLPGTKDVFGEHNPMRELPNWLSGDAAGELLRFFQKIDASTGDLIHDFTDPDWDTRFLGDLYQDLSEAARKKYALLQTPDFVEEFILDRTLDPALDEFGLDATAIEGRDGKPITKPGFRMIDPACGSGHFLLGSFPRILNRWQKKEPGTNIRELVQRTLASIHGVDINPFAIAIARFRLLLAALKACEITRLADAPAFAMNLACGDSLYHGKERQLMLDGVESDESHYFRTEDAEYLRRILKEGTFHAVVANPPYITVKDKAASTAYRRLYRSCHRQYSLAVPFMERIFRLASNGDVAGFTGQITANSFMKREFGKPLIEDFLPCVELTHLIDTSGAFIPGHGTPTTILVGRNRSRASTTVRAVLGIRGEPGTPELPREGKVWVAIVDQIDRVDSQSEFVSCRDLSAERLEKHPWSLGGGGVAELYELVDSLAVERLSDVADTMGRTASTSGDDVFVVTKETALRHRIPYAQWRPFVCGEDVRDWFISPSDAVLFPYDERLSPIEESAESDDLLRFLWPSKSPLSNTLLFGQTKVQAGMNWFEYGQFMPERLKDSPRLAFAFIATHNHFVVDEGRSVFNRSAPVTLFSSDFDLKRSVQVLNSSTACFWLRQTFTPKGGHGIGRGIQDEEWESRYEFDVTKLKRFPMPRADASSRTHRLLTSAKEVASRSPKETLLRWGNELAQDQLSALIASLPGELDHQFSRLVSLQEDLDWECYRLYGLLEEDLTYPGESLGIQLGERAFEIVLARKMAAGEVATTWFERHRSQPITELPSHWPDDYKKLVQRRIDVIQSNPQIALIEKPEYKRRWNTEPWESQVERALKSWLLNRLESYFDFDGRMNDEGSPTSKIDISLTSVAKLADLARQDEQFMEVAEVYRDDPAFDVQRLVDELVKGEQVPLLPVLRYKANGLRNRAEWEETWELQRLEDKLRANEQVVLTDYELSEEQREAITKWQKDTPANQKADDRNLDKILSIPVPPKYKSGDFISSGGARYWSLRGKLDVPKERWVSFPHCEGPDGTLMIAWAGYNHLQLAQAISAYYIDVQERLGGRDDPRLIPLLAGVIELLPWLKQWHHEIDPEYNQRMDEVYEGFVTEEAKGLNLTIEEIKAWQPPQRTGGRRRRATS